MKRISLDLKNNYIYIYTDVQQGVEHLMSPIEKNSLRPFISDESILLKSDCFTFDFENNIISVNETPAGVLYEDKFIIIESIDKPDLNKYYNQFLKVIGYGEESITQEDIWKAILNIR